VGARQPYLKVRVVNIIERKVGAIFVERLKVDNLPSAVRWQVEIDATINVIAWAEVAM
jgi:hypothetical protein